MSLNTRILAFDTSSVRGSVALLEGRELRAELRLNSLETHSKQLLSSIDFLLKRLNWTLKDLNLVVVGMGPGSFTGIRIGVATALGFAQSLSIPYAGISGLEALAYRGAFVDGRLGTVLDAHRSQAYYAEYESRDGKVRQVQAAALFGLSDLERHIANRHLYIVGDADVCLSGKPAWPRRLFVDMFLAAEMGRLALSNRRRWRAPNSMMAEPMYIRPPDALKNKSRNLR